MNSAVVRGDRRALEIAEVIVHGLVLDSAEPVLLRREPAGGVEFARADGGSNQPQRSGDDIAQAFAIASDYVAENSTFLLILLRTPVSKAELDHVARTFEIAGVVHDLDVRRASDGDSGFSGSWPR